MVRFGVWKLVVLLVLTVAALQIVHMFLLNRLDNLRSSVPQQQQPKLPFPSSSFVLPLSYSSSSLELTTSRSVKEQNFNSSTSVMFSIVDFRKMMNIYEKSSILDSSGEYKIVNFLVRKMNYELEVEEEQGEDDVTLVTQCSVQHVLQLVPLAERWNGPISVSLFVSRLTDIPKTFLTLARLRYCHQTVRNSTSFHLVYPLKGTDLDGQFLETERLLKHESSRPNSEYCTQVGAFGSNGPLANYYLDGGAVPYPNNLLRNVARRNALTEFVFVVDADMVPSENLRNSFVSFARSNGLFDSEDKDEKIVYVVPSFEMRDSEEVPRDKGELVRMIKQFSSCVRPFYWELCRKCQMYTNYDSWQREPIVSKLGVLFEVLWKDPWEPFYFSRNTVPFYDERFKQYGFNRISQVCELHIAGYRFSVLNNAFLVHRGLKKMDSFHRKKDEDQELNRLLFRLFKTQLKEKYPESSRRCY